MLNYMNQFLQDRDKDRWLEKPNPPHKAKRSIFERWFYKRYKKRSIEVSYETEER